jgi:hypothetical protein
MKLKPVTSETLRLGPLSTSASAIRVKFHADT